jgi:hypothetical protein
MTSRANQPPQAYAAWLLWLRHTSGAYRELYEARGGSLALAAYELAVAKLMVDPERILDAPEDLVPTRLELNSAAGEIARALDLTPPTGTLLVRELDAARKPVRP